MPPVFSNILEVGCGSALIAKYVAQGLRSEATVTLLDIDPLALEYAKSPYCGLPSSSVHDHKLLWHFEAGDAAEFLAAHNI